MIQLQNINFWYNKNYKLFNELDLSLEPGNIYGLLGKNGAGKTTLLKIITGMLNPKSGTCTLNNQQSINRKTETLQELFFIPEEFELPNVTASKYASLYACFYPKFDQSIFFNCLSEFGVDANTQIKQLSFGQKKQVLISFGVATNTRYLILDEPTNALDIPSKSTFRKILASAVNEQRSIIISTHQIRDLEQMIDPIIVLDQGKVIFNYNQETIAEKLVFKTVANLDDANVLYAEEKLGAFTAICKNSDNEFSNINMELLFNGVTANSGAFNLNQN